jgi:hypothetical protein
VSLTGLLEGMMSTDRCYSKSRVTAYMASVMKIHVIHPRCVVAVRKSICRGGFRPGSDPVRVSLRGVSKLYAEPGDMHILEGNITSDDAQSFLSCDSRL